MDPSLRELLDHSKFDREAVRAVTPLLPPSDEALAALVTELCASGDQLGFLLVMTAATDACRSLDAALLIRGAGLCGEEMRLGCFAWKMHGDVAGALVTALERGRYALEIQAAMLLVAAMWAAKHRGGELPARFAAEARTLARLKELRPAVSILLTAAACLVKDESLLAVIHQHHAVTLRPEVRTPAEAYAEKLVPVFEGAAIDLVPAEAPKALSARQPIHRATEKHGRNDPCPCGSGKKYKRCCFEKDQARWQFSSGVANKTVAELRVAPETGLTEGRLKKLTPFELAQLDPRKIPDSLRTVYIMQCTGTNLLERSAEALEVMTFTDAADFQSAWNFVAFFAMRGQHKEIAERLMAARSRYPMEMDAREGIQLLLARDDPPAELLVLGDTAAQLLRETDHEKLSDLAYGLLCSRHAALGILVAHGFIARLDRRWASFLLEGVLAARDRLNLPPEDAISDLLEKRLAEETNDEGADATRLREARQRLELKAAEVRALKEEIDHQRRRLDRPERTQREQAAAPVSSPVPVAVPAEDAALREMRGKLAQLKGRLDERAAERLALRQELERARDELETLRQDGQGAPASAAESGGAGEDETAFYLPAPVGGNQPLRLAEYPPRFRQTLEALPRQAARAALALIGRLAGGEPAAFAGVVQLKACHGVLRQRVGSEHRLLFRLQPERVEVIDFINRRDLDRTIKRLRAAG